MTGALLKKNRQLREWTDLTGHTIKSVIDYPCGKRNVSAVIITETGCWMVLDTEGNAFYEKPLILVDPPYCGGQDIPLDEYLSAREMLHAGLINDATYKVLDDKQRQEADRAKKAKVELLRKQLEELERDAV